MTVNQPATEVQAIDFGPDSRVPGPLPYPPTGIWPTEYWREGAVGDPANVGHQRVDTGWTTSTVKDY